MATLNKSELFDHLNRDNYLFLNHHKCSLDILSQAPINTLIAFTQSWNDLPTDTYIEKENPYRQRRYAILQWKQGILEKAEHEAHYQSKLYNHVYGGINRKFSPISNEILDNSIFRNIVHWNIKLLNAQKNSNWKVQCHQFRILTTAKKSGKPTPEGIHQDGSNYVFIMLVDRQNISGGISQIYNNMKQLIQSKTLLKKGEAILLNDKELFHSVSEVSSYDKKTRGHRDVLVLTFHKSHAP